MAYLSCARSKERGRGLLGTVGVQLCGSSSGVHTEDRSMHQSEWGFLKDTQE